MRRVEEELPSVGVHVIAYCESGGAYIARYKKVLTWRGWKHKFVSECGDIFHNDVIGWNRIPQREDTF